MGWNYDTTVGLVVLLGTWPLGFYVFLSRPGHASNRLLGAILFMEGMGVAGYRLNDVAPTAGVALAMGAVASIAIIAIPPLYLAFLGVALRGPLAGPFAKRAARALLWAWGVAALPLVLLWPAEILGRLHAAPDGFDFELTGTNRTLAFLVAFAALYNLAASIAAFYASPRGSVARTQAKWFAAAFGTRDAIVVPTMIYIVWNGENTVVVSTGFLAGLLYAPLLSYALLRHQIFDIDVRIKRSISRGALATLFIAVFLVASQLGEQFAQEVIGRQAWVIGGVAAGLLVFALTPLQRFADSLANRALPKATGTDEYLSFKKLEVYRAAVEGIARDGRISPRERSVLERLQAKLGIAAAAAQQLEREALAVAAPKPRAMRRTAAYK